MWIYLALFSAFVLGIYEVAKKHAVTGNAVLPVLACTTTMGAIFFLPSIISGNNHHPLPWLPESFVVTPLTLRQHLLIVIKALIVGSGWILGFFALKRLPISVAAPLGTLGPVLTVIGSIALWHERLNPLQWTGLAITIVSYFLFSAVSAGEGIVFRKNKWVLALGITAALNAMSSLLDKYLVPHLGAANVQAWFSVYMAGIMIAILLALWMPSRKAYTPFSWRFSIPLVALLLLIADFSYYRALAFPDALLAVVGPVRRGNIVVAFCVGSILFKEKNILKKGLVILLMLCGIVLISSASHR